MKKVVLGLIAILMLWSCDELTYDYTTNLEQQIDIAVENSGTVLKSNSNSFTVIDTLSLEDNEDINEYLDQLESITITGATYEVQGLPEGAVVSDLTLKVLNTDFVVTVDEISENNNVVDLDVDPEMLTQVSDYAFEHKEIIVEVTGTTNMNGDLFTLMLNYATEFSVSVIENE